MQVALSHTRACISDGQIPSSRYSLRIMESSSSTSYTKAGLNHAQAPTQSSSERIGAALTVNKDLKVAQLNSAMKSNTRVILVWLISKRRSWAKTSACFFEASQASRAVHRITSINMT
jgi:hypothetical protein